MKDVNLSKKGKLTADILTLDCEKELEKIVSVLQKTVLRQFKKRGFVVALSGGIDSSVVGAICVAAAGKDKVLGLLMPEKDSSPDSTRRGKLMADFLGIKTIIEDITPILETVGCYRRRDEAIKTLIPEYDSGHKCKIVLPDILAGENYRIFSVVTESPNGEQRKARLTLSAYLQIVAATNFKQRVRKMLEYYHADRLNYAVAGTPNRQEYDQGFFVKLGDGAADVKPIAHLYKTQVYQMAEYFGLPEEIRKSVPTTDTYPLSQTQEEFFFSVPYDKFDLCLYGKDHNIPASEIAMATGLTEEQVKRIFDDIEHKRNVAHYLHAPPIMIEQF